MAAAKSKKGITAAEFCRIALSFDGAEQGEHAGEPDFRVGGRKFATLASRAEGFANLQLTPEDQAAFCEEWPEVFLPIAGGWGRMGHTHLRLAAATEEIARGAVQAAWRLRVSQNAKTKSRGSAAKKRPSAR